MDVKALKYRGTNSDKFHEKVKQLNDALEQVYSANTSEDTISNIARAKSIMLELEDIARAKSIRLTIRKSAQRRQIRKKGPWPGPRKR